MRSPLKDWLNLFAVFVSATMSSSNIWEVLFCHDITTCNVANSEMFWVNTFVNFMFSFRGEKINKGLTEIYFVSPV